MRRQSGNGDSFVAKARKIHGDAYDYGLVDYQRSNRKVTIVCRVHGPFEQTPNSHISRKAGCPKCAGKGMDTGEFVAKAIATHGVRYSYARTEYRLIKGGVTITCPVHGDFRQTAEAHLIGHGCPQCWRESYASKTEHELASWIADQGFEVVRNTRDAIGNGMEIDIFIPERRIGIEFNGCYWHSDRVNKNTRQHEFKHVAAARAGIRLVTVWDFEWARKRPVVERMLLHAIGTSCARRVGARACVIEEVTNHDAAAFYAENHIQGPCRGGIVNLALVHDGRPVAMMTFTRGGARRGIVVDGEWELARYATSAMVPGGASRLFRHFVRTMVPSTVWSFSDNQHFGGSLYQTLGFTHDGTIRPDYTVVHPGRLSTWHKSLWQRKSIQKRLSELGIDEAYDHRTDPRTERQMQDFANVLRVWDSGKTRWKWVRLATLPGRRQGDRSSRPL